MELNWNRKPGAEALKSVEVLDVPYLLFEALEETGLVRHGFSTRLGGVSEGCFSTMNLAFTKGDNKDHVMENYRRMARALNVDLSGMVLSHQTHTTNIKKVTAEDRGKGLFTDRDYTDVDGLITDVAGVTLVTFYADCVPLFFLDPVHHAVGLSHSGWRGTVNQMGPKTVKAMTQAYGSNPADLIACIGPSICGDCYEVGEEVANQVKDGFPQESWSRILETKGNGKYQLDLWAANEYLLETSGIPKNKIHVTDICTHCNPSYLFSHRHMGNERGNLAAFLQLKQ